MATYEEEGSALMDELLATGPVRDIAATIQACNFSEEAFILTENFPSYPVNDQRERQKLLRFARLKNGFDVNNTTSGRVFHKTFELRWEKREREYWAIYLGERREVPGLATSQELRDLLDGLEQRKKPKRYYLFGEVLNPEDPDKDKARSIKAMGIEATDEYY